MAVSCSQARATPSSTRVARVQGRNLRNIGHAEDVQGCRFVEDNLFDPFIQERRRETEACHFALAVGG